VRLNSELLRRRAAGLLLTAVGAFALTAPVAVGQWSLALLGVPLIALSVVEAYLTFASTQRAEIGAYLSSVLAMLAGNLLLLSSALVLNGLMILLFAILLFDGLAKILTVRRRSSSERFLIVVNGLIDFACVALLWYLGRTVGGERAVGIIIGIYILAAGWRMLLAPLETPASASACATASDDPTLHPDPGLGLAPNEAFVRLHADIDSAASAVRATNFLWMLTLGGVFLAIHVGRMPTSDTVLGIVSPFVATVGDILMTLALATAVVLPWRLLWRRFTRPIERLAWSLHLGAAKSDAASMNPAAAWLIGNWLSSRFHFTIRLRQARISLSSALILLLYLGLPLTAFFVAFNPVWGFSWYFNTESWASAVYQKLTEIRVDPWRASMVDAVTKAYGGGDELFRIRPDGVDGNGDFSFLVIGDPGEGDASQYSLVSHYLKLGLHDELKFLVVSSDVIYPAGSMHDYEANFYLPFQGFAKPIYAIPGNHDWFDAIEGFNANFLEPKAARAAMEARVDADLGLTTTNARRIDRLIADAARLRRLYGVNAGNQRAAFFELQTDGFALLAIDTGILRTIDERQSAWVERVLERGRGKFIMAILGHPRIAGGHDIPQTAEGHDVSGSAEKFAALYQLLAKHNVRIAMAGDTHDFEYYKERLGSDRDNRVMHHFVNGGGGAYLSIGTALDFPNPGPVADWAFYPRTDRLRTKLDAETPLWKQPFWQWIKWFNAWPVSVEALSGLFDFNRAPFFQSFMQVRVERSKRRIVLTLYGAAGPLRWSDLQISGAVLPPEATPDDPVEFIVSME
jgi:uncharacterized membrane protein HdeD (DUF308 family)